MKTCSVIIPTWNRRALLSKALGSIYAQDSCPWALEVIVVDDGSTDGTDQLVKSEWDKVKYYRTPHLGKPGLVRNVGLEVATGDFIAYLDSDDLWLSHHLITAHQYFERNPSIQMVSNHWVNMHRKGNILKPIRRQYNPLPNTNCHVHRANVGKSVGGFNKKHWGEDADFFNRIASSYCTVRTGIVTTINCYTRGGNNITYQYCQDIKELFQ